MSAINRFLGDTPLRVFFKLLIVSFLVGIVMATMGWSPWDVYYAVADFFEGIWMLGFDAVYRFWGYIVLGAVVVIPAFLLLRLASFRR
jgi:hypothetical protein